MSRSAERAITMPWLPRGTPCRSEPTRPVVTTRSPTSNSGGSSNVVDGGTGPPQPISGSDDGDGEPIFVAFRPAVAVVSPWLQVIEGFPLQQWLPHRWREWR